MKSIIIIQFSVLLLMTVSNGDILNPIVPTLERMAKESESVNDIFEPSKKKGLLLELENSVIYKGKINPTKREVAMIFSNCTRTQEFITHEYAMYTYLKAINDPDVEAFGIPSVYYHGMWRQYGIMAITLVDREYYHCLGRPMFTEIDLLIVIREYVRITKYMHTNGVFCEYIKLYDIKFRKHQGFVNDFRLARALPGKTRVERLQAARNDWKKFLNSLYIFFEVSKSRWSWIGLSKKNPYDIRRMDDITKFVSSLIFESYDSHNFDGLRKVLIEFAKYAHCNDTITTTPFYDQLYEVIIEELDGYVQKQKKPAILSWLSDPIDILKAMSAIQNISSILTIEHPFKLEKIEYKEVKYDFFSTHYRDFIRHQPSSSGASGGPDTEKTA